MKRTVCGFPSIAELCVFCVFDSMESLIRESVFVGFGITFLLCCFLYKSKIKSSKVKYLPGPRPWPVIGSLHLLGGLPHQSLATLAKKYGSIMFLRLGSVPTVVVSSPAMAEEFLKTHDLVFANRPKCAHGKYSCYDHQDLAFSPYGETWRQMRKLCTVELFTVKRSESFGFVREEEVSAMINSIMEEGAHGVQCVDVRKLLTSVTENITCRMFAGRTYSVNDLAGHSFGEMVADTILAAGKVCIGDYIPSLSWLDIQGLHRRLQANHRIFDRFAENVIDEHVDRRLGKGKTCKEETGVKDIIDVMLDLAETEGQTISRIHIKAVIIDMITGGMETSALLVEWAMSELLRKPSTLSRAQKEIECAVGRNRRVKESDVVKLEYLRCVVKETFRLHPPVPLLLPHESMEGCNVGGYFIPPKTRLLVNVWAIGRDEDVWKDADQFKPERFMGSDKDVKGQHFDLLPFGSGRRGCPGINMGLSVSEFALAQLLHCFDWTVEGQIDMEEECGFSCPKKNPLLAYPSLRLTGEHAVLN